MEQVSHDGAARGRSQVLTAAAVGKELGQSHGAVGGLAAAGVRCELCGGCEEQRRGDSRSAP